MIFLRTLPHCLLALFWIIAVFLFTPVSSTAAGEGLTHLEIGKLGGQAGNYGRSGEGIGIVVLVGDDGVQHGYTPELVGQSFVTLFEQQGVSAKAFTGYNGALPTAISYFLRVSAYGPYSIATAVESVETSAQNFDRDKRVAELIKDLEASVATRNEMKLALIMEFGEDFVEDNAALYLGSEERN